MSPPDIFPCDYFTVQYLRKTQFKSKGEKQIYLLPKSKNREIYW